MNPTFTSLLEQAGFDTRERGFWQRIIVDQSRCEPLEDRFDEGERMVTEGFKAILLDRHGNPTHHCKCRPPSKAWVRQTALCARMSIEPALRQLIPETRGVGSPDLLMSISPYLPGPLLESTVFRMWPASLGTALREILLAMETVSVHGALVDGDMCAAQTHLDLAAEAEWAFETIPSSQLTPAQAVVLREAIAGAGNVRAELQHGDLWPANILEHDGHWWLLDFELFGRIQVPLYDVFHLVHSCWMLRQEMLQRLVRWGRRDVPSWIESLRVSGTAPSYQRTLAWARIRHGFTNREAVGLLSFYVLDMAARMYRRQVGTHYLEPYVRDLRVLAECLAAHETFSTAFSWKRVIRDRSSRA